MKDMRDMVNAAPGMVQQAQQMGAQAQEMAAAQQAAAQARMAAYQAQQGGGFNAPGAAPAGPDFEPIAGVSLEQFAAISKGVAAYNYDASKLVDVAASKGVDAASWETAHVGWNDRIKANPAVAQRFNLLYRAA
ncbi:MAG TPA: hypothetical protein VFI65_33345 [Streptosporangiaceae bacterium]|nr:hypothetical protein [Streptosporangiaceae bacterium]